MLSCMSTKRGNNALKKLLYFSLLTFENYIFFLSGFVNDKVFVLRSFLILVSFLDSHGSIWSFQTGTYNVYYNCCVVNAQSFKIIRAKEWEKRWQNILALRNARNHEFQHSTDFYSQLFHLKRNSIPKMGSIDLSWKFQDLSTKSNLDQIGWEINSPERLVLILKN